MKQEGMNNQENDATSGNGKSDAAKESGATRIAPNIRGRFLSDRFNDVFAVVVAKIPPTCQAEIGRLSLQESSLWSGAVAAIVNEDFIVDPVNARAICGDDDQALQGAIVLPLADAYSRRQVVDGNGNGHMASAPHEIAATWGFGEEISRFRTKANGSGRAESASRSASIEVADSPYTFLIAHVQSGEVRIDVSRHGERLASITLDSRSSTAKQQLSLEFNKLEWPTAGISSQAVHQVLAAALRVVMDSICPVVGKDADTHAAEFLKAPDLSSRLLDDMSRVGFLADPNVGRVLYLCKISALLDEPVYVYLVGPSSSLKTRYADLTASLTPHELLKHLTDLTRQALYYGPRNLAHHVIVLDEMDLRRGGQALDQKLLRMLHSKGWCEIETTQGGKSGRKHVQGPVMVIQTTVATSFDEQDLSRNLVIDLPDSPERTEIVLELMGQQYAGLTKQDEVQQLIELHRAVHRRLPMGAEVLVPFAPTLSALLPIERMTILRTYRTIISLVKAHTLLHFRQRRQDKKGRILAIIDDYRAVYDCAREFLVASIGGSDLPSRAIDLARLVIEKRAAHALAWARNSSGPEHAELLRMGEEAFVKRHLHWGDWVSIHQIVELTDRRRPSVQRRLRELEAAELIEMRKEGRAFQYRLTTPDGQLPICPQLPSPDDVERGHLGISD